MVPNEVKPRINQNGYVYFFILKETYALFNGKMHTLAHFNRCSGQFPVLKEKSTSTDSPLIEQIITKTSASQSDGSKNSSRRRKQSGTASFDRVAAWVKDVSSDLGHNQTPSQQSFPCSESLSSCHRSCCSRRHRSHSRRRHRRSRHSHHGHRHHESSCSKCTRDTCALCEVENRCCSRACHKCTYCDKEREQASGLSNHSSSQISASKREGSSEHPSTEP